MNRRKGFFSSKFVGYLEWVHFEVKADKPRFVPRLILDAIVALSYSGVSIGCILYGQIDSVVLGLNILCVIRTTIFNSIEASKITIIKRKNQDLSKTTVSSHYHWKTTVLMTSLFFIVFLWIGIIIEQTKPIWIQQFLACMALILVCLNDLENILVSAYDAQLVP